MQQKIEWYKEVLDLEPSSRVFFPLARLLAAQNQLTGAIAVLEQGLSYYPDHIEARLQLIEYLLEVKDWDKVEKLINALSSIFCAYPGFLDAWSRLLAEQPHFKDASLALRFFTLALQGKPVSWAEVIEQGLVLSLPGTGDGVFLREDSAKKAVSAMPFRAENAHHGSSGLSPQPRLAGKNVAVVPEASLSSEVLIDDGDNHAAGVAMPLYAERGLPDNDFEKRQSDSDYDALDGDDEEPFSLRTRSMAEILAEQGDYAGAIDIYTELLNHASEDERSSFVQRLDELQSKLTAPFAPDSLKDDKKNEGAQSARLADLLESLAQSLEARAR